MKNKRVQSLFIATFVVILVLIIDYLRLLDPIENKLWDLRVMALSDTKDHDPNIKIILIDQNALDWAKESNGLSWPWPREMYSAIIEYCAMGGAKAVVFDIIFSEPSLYGNYDDERFSKALKRIPSFGVLFLSDTQGDVQQWPHNIYNRVNIKEHNLTRRMKKNATFPVRPIESSFTAFGSVLASPDSDGVIRRIQLMDYFDDVRVPTLSMSVYEYIFQKIIPDLDTQSKKIINFHGPAQTYDTYNAATIIQSKLQVDSTEIPSLKSEVFKDSYVYLGVSAPGLMDVKITPIHNIYPGVEVHATVLDNIIHDNFIQNISFHVAFLFLILVSFLNTFGIRFNESLQRSFLFPVIIFIVIILCAIFVYYMHVWLKIAPLLFALIVSSFITFSINYMLEGRERRFIRTAFSQYLSPKVIETLIEDPSMLKLGGKKEQLTILFSDIEGFTKISSTMEAEEVAYFLNEYLGYLSDIIMDLGGTIDKYEGDAIIAFWNAPVWQENHADLAVNAALQCQKLLREKKGYFLDTFGHEFKTRFGIHTGDVIIGNLGTHKRFDYTFIGDAGNLAARLESANKQFSSYIMISEVTKKLLLMKHYYRELGNIKVVGRDEPLRVYEPMLQDDVKIEQLESYMIALDHFYNNELDKAKIKFESISTVDLVAKRYMQIIDQVENKIITYENGVLSLSEK